VDTTSPTNPTAGHIYSNSGKTTEYASGSWGNASAPYLTWSGAADNEGGSGLKQYRLYFGTSASADPMTTSGVLAVGYYEHIHVGANGAEQNLTVPSALTNGQTYYFKVLTQDNDLNWTDSATTLLSYKYDVDNPTIVDSINISPVGCSIASTFDFTWDASADVTSGIQDYQYKKGSSGTITSNGDSTTLSIAPYQEGDNVLYIRSRDMGGNTSDWQSAVFCSTASAHIIDGPTVTAGPSSLSVVWVSSKQTTSYVQVYQGNTYVSEQGLTDYSILHTVNTIGLEPSTAYRYRLRWTDQYGNLGESDWYETTTKNAPSVSNMNLDMLTPTSYNVSWDFSEDCSPVIMYGIGNYDGLLSINGYSSAFSQKLENLISGSNYKLRIKGITRDGYTFYSDSYPFSTPPIPIVSNLRFEPIEDQPESALRVTWTTNIPTTSSVHYGALGGSTKEISNTDMNQSHELEIPTLLDNTTYSIYVTGMDQFGNVAISDINTVTTKDDTRPPMITDLVIETSNQGTGEGSRSQLVISWKTDELATSQVEYGEGSSSDSYTNKTQEDATLQNTHMIIIGNLDPSRVYHLRAVSKDKAGNLGYSLDNAYITKKKTESIFDIIIDTLTRAFSWLKFLNK
jgi:hypothetical protein